MTDVKTRMGTLSLKRHPPEEPVLQKSKESSSLREEKRERKRQAMEWLMQAFPLCFNVKDPKPLKRKIEQDILNQWVYLSSLPYERPIPSRLLLRRAVGWYATRSTYYAAFNKATHRVDLEGKQAQEITEAEKAYAMERLTVMKEYYEKNRKPKKKKSAVVKDPVKETS